MPAKSQVPTITTDELRQKLKLKHYEAVAKLNELHYEATDQLRKKGIDIDRVREHSAKLLSAGTLAGTLMLSAPDQARLLPPPQELYTASSTAEDTNNPTIPAMSPKATLLSGIKQILPEKPRPLDRTEEKYLEQLFEKTTGIKAKATLEGEHLNTTYGYIGAEQHLIRYPGDSLAQHAVPEEGLGYEYNDILEEGIAPGKGAWGYFAPSKAAMTKELEETERWYAVVQTLYLPDWNVRQPHLKNWYKYRKVLILNVDNGNAVVASIADSGPAAWTGKHFGGSPEVMDYLGGPRYKKGAVVLFFVDDPQNQVPLGPVDYNQIQTQGGLIEI